MKKFFYIERIQQWINIFKIVTIYRTGPDWNIILEGNNNVVLNDGEYANLIKDLNEPPRKPDHKEE